MSLFSETRERMPKQRLLSPGLTSPQTVAPLLHSLLTSLHITTHTLVLIVDRAGRGPWMLWLIAHPLVSVLLGDLSITVSHYLPRHHRSELMSQAGQ